MPASYLDFLIDVNPGQDGLHEISARSQAGEQRAFAEFPLIDRDLELYLTKLENAILRSVGTRRRVLSPEEEAVQTFGRHLFDFLFAGEIAPLFRECQRLADAQQQGVRLKLNIRAPQLAALPWEFLYDSRRRDYLCLDPHTPLVRYNEMAQPMSPLSVNAPLRILGMIAQPRDVATLDISHEMQRIEEALAPLQRTGQVELTWVNGQSAFDLQRAMRRGPWHIFHFIGHGGFDRQRDEGFLALAGENGESERLYTSQLARLLRMQRATLRLALLNACESARANNLDIFSSTAATLLGDGLPAVLAMQYEITDGAAKQFSQTFYEALADNLPIDSAVSDARNAISLRDRLSLEWGTPVLFLRSEDGRLFHLAVNPNGAETAKTETLIAKSAEKEDRPLSRQEKATANAEESAKPQPIWQQIGIELVHIPAGSFFFGKEKKESTLPDFWIARTPITNEQYKLFVDATSHRLPDHWQNGRIPNGKEKHPVVYIALEDAQAFCSWAGVKLPSEQQWEKAARGSDGRTYPWGEQAPDATLCNFGNHEVGTTPVGKYPQGASPYGVLEMAGNVWEWLAEWFDESRIYVVLRGGSFSAGEVNLRTSFRYRLSPDGRGGDRGFRVVSE